MAKCFNENGACYPDIFSITWLSIIMESGVYAQF